MKPSHRRRGRTIDLDLDRYHAPLPEQRRTCRRIADMRLQPAHHVTPIGISRHAAAAIDQTGIKQLDQRCEMRIVAVMRRRREQQQSVAAPRDHLRQPPSLRILAIRARPGTDAMMRLVNDRQIPRRSLEFLQHAFLLREIERCQAKRNRVERIAAELKPSPLLLQRSGIGDRR